MRSFLSLILLAIAACGQGSSWAGVESGLARAVAEAGRNGLEVGCAVMDPESGAQLFGVQAQRLMIPASNEKVFTAAAALLALGPEHRVLTDLVAHGEVQNGVLDGVLRLRGEGDPTLESERVLPHLVARIKAAGIQRVRGALVLDDRLFDRELRGPQWPEEDPAKAWMAAVAPLSLDHGTVQVRVRAGAGVGAPAGAEVLPAGAAPLQSVLITGKSARDHLVAVTRAEGSEVLRVSGRVAPWTKAQAHAVAVQDPTLAFGNALLAACESAGIRIDGGVRRADAAQPSGGRLLARLRTRVGDILPLLLKSSQNHRAEMMFKHLGAAFAGSGSFAGGSRAVHATLQKAGVDLGGTVLADGSGLSRANRTTAAALAQVLCKLWASPMRREICTALPHGGEDGSTLERRFQDLGAKVCAKTGTLQGVSTLSGFVQGSGGRTLCFSVLVQVAKAGKLSAREVQDSIVRALARHGPER